MIAFTIPQVVGEECDGPIRPHDANFIKPTGLM